jgi:tetratricopeptide (TPR) repeat protein
LDNVDIIIKLWEARLVALFKLGEYDALEYEFKNLQVNRDSLTFENFKNTGQTGPIIPFQISIMYCRVPLLKQNYTEAIERLYALFYSLKYKDKSCEILIQIGTALTKMEDYFLATQVFKCVSESMDDTDPQKLEIDSIRGRIFLQLGDLETASLIFEEISRKSGNNSRLFHINNALQSIFNGNWEDAILDFSKILQLSPNDWLIENNIAILELYKGHVSDALARLDELLVKYPKEMATSSEAIFNLSTVYDLVDQSLERKKSLLANVISPFSGDDFQINSLKL